MLGLHVGAREVATRVLHREIDAVIIAIDVWAELQMVFVIDEGCLVGQMHRDLGVEFKRTPLSPNMLLKRAAVYFG